MCQSKLLQGLLSSEEFLGMLCDVDTDEMRKDFFSFIFILLFYSKLSVSSLTSNMLLTVRFWWCYENFILFQTVTGVFELALES